MARIERLTRNELRGRVRSFASAAPRARGLARRPRRGRGRQQPRGDRRRACMRGGRRARSRARTPTGRRRRCSAASSSSTPDVLIGELRGRSDARHAPRCAITDRRARRVPAVAAIRSSPSMTRRRRRHRCRCYRASELPAGDDDGGEWPRFDFNHPLFVMFSSGTTGPPEVHRARSRRDVAGRTQRNTGYTSICARRTRCSSNTTTAWMMWNWQLSALACGSPIVTYSRERSPNRARCGSSSRSTTSASLARARPTCGCARTPVPRRVGSLALGALRAVLSTGSILHDWQFDWVRDARRRPVAAVDLGRNGHHRLLPPRQPRPAGPARHAPVPEPRH